MASHKKEPPDSPTEDPEKRGNETEQSLARYATTVGIVTGLFGMLFGVGLILLPTATIRERVLVIGASLAVSVAGLTGVGAWRSRRRFGLTALAGGLALVCLVGLSVVASGVRSTARAAAGGSSASQTNVVRKTGSASTTQGTSSHGSSHPTHDSSATPSSSPTASSTGSSGAVDTAFLSDLSGDPVTGPHWVGPLSGSWSIGDTTYSESLGYRNLCGETTSIVYNLDKPYKNFLAEAGIANGWSAYDNGTEATLTVFGETGAGHSRLLSSATAEGGDPSLLDAQIPSGTTELELTTNIMDAACMQDAVIVWGNARLTP